MQTHLNLTSSFYSSNHFFFLFLYSLLLSILAFRLLLFLSSCSCERLLANWFFPRSDVVEIKALFLLLIHFLEPSFLLNLLLPGIGILLSHNVHEIARVHLLLLILLLGSCHALEYFLLLLLSFLLFCFFLSLFFSLLLGFSLFNFLFLVG